jgi:hypothetical protein
MPASVPAHRDPGHTSEGGSSTDWSLAARVWVDAGERQQVGNRVGPLSPVAPGHLAGWRDDLNAPAVEAIRATYSELLIADSLPPCMDEDELARILEPSLWLDEAPSGLPRALVAARPREYSNALTCRDPLARADVRTSAGVVFVGNDRDLQ